MRQRAIQVVGFHPTLDLLENVASLLGDAETEVRREALLVVGPREAARVVLDETLLACLRDPNPELGIPRTVNTNGLDNRVQYQLDGMPDTESDQYGLRLFAISDSYVREIQTVSNSFAPEFKLPISACNCIKSPNFAKLFLENSRNRNATFVF